MSTGRLAKCLFSFIFDQARCSESAKNSNFGDNYVWVGSLESGLKLADNHKKPMMVIIHKSWCSACKKLKAKFAISNDIQALSKHFVLVSLMDDEEPTAAAYAPDGGYVPRILFVSPEGAVDTDIYNEDGSSQYKFFYSKPEHIAKSMRRVLEKYKQQIDTN